jgi:hypothetical protein
MPLTDDQSIKFTQNLKLSLATAQPESFTSMKMLPPLTNRLHQLEMLTTSAWLEFFLK